MWPLELARLCFLLAALVNKLQNRWFHAGLQLKTNKSYFILTLTIYLRLIISHSERSLTLCILAQPVTGTVVEFTVIRRKYYRKTAWKIFLEGTCVAVVCTQLWATVKEDLKNTKLLREMMPIFCTELSEFPHTSRRRTCRKGFNFRHVSFPKRSPSYRSSSYIQTYPSPRFPIHTRKYLHAETLRLADKTILFSEHEVFKVLYILKNIQLKQFVYS